VGAKRVAEHIDHKKLLVAKTAGLSGPYVRNLSGQRCALGVDAIGLMCRFLLARRRWRLASLRLYVKSRLAAVSA